MAQELRGDNHGSGLAYDFHVSEEGQGSEICRLGSVYGMNTFTLRSQTSLSYNILVPNRCQH